MSFILFYTNFFGLSQMSGFPIKKTLDDFDFSFQPSIDKRQIDELATMRFLENGENGEPEKVCVKENKRHPFSQELEQETNMIERMYH